MAGHAGQSGTKVGDCSLSKVTGGSAPPSLQSSSRIQESWTKSTQTPLGRQVGGLTPSLAITFCGTMSKSQLCGGSDVSVQQV